MGRLPANHNQPYGISSADSMHPLHALAVRMRDVLGMSNDLEGIG